MLLVTTAVHAVTPPEAQFSLVGSGNIQANVHSSETVSGYNIYVDGTYLTTVRPPAGVKLFEFSGTAGSYCVVGFVEYSANTEYSSCSSLVQVSGSGPGHDPETGSAPSAPANLRGVFYSATVGEIFWDAASDDGYIASYQVFRDGQLLVQRDARSYFEPLLDKDRVYHYQVISVDNDGNESAAAKLALGENGGAQNNAEFTVTLPKTSYDLYEGESSGVTVPISVSRVDGNQRNINFSLRAGSARDEVDITSHFLFTSLSADQTYTQVKLELAIGIAPETYRGRQYVLIATDGGSTVETPLVFNVKPINAPDVYLLIGQSNMEGYSENYSKNSQAGGLDERVDRVRQLNVQSNNRSLYPVVSDFINENKNIFNPRYIRAEDPLHEPLWPGQNSKGATFVGLGLTFAKAALTQTSNEIYLVPAAWGATGFCANGMGELAWNAYSTSHPSLGGTLLADRALTRLNATLRDTGGILRGILWHQGGADSNNPDCAFSYADNLKKLVARIRNDARVDRRGSVARGSVAKIPFVVATMSKGNDDRGNFSAFSNTKLEVDRVHRSIAELIPFADYVNNDDLVPPAYQCGQTSCVHFGAAALREQGHRFYQALQRILGRS